jgi:hypothetical protein
VKKIKQPGENISLKTKKNESPDVMDWINGQSNLMDSIRYLVENEIREHGVRNLQLLIPAERGALVAGSGAPAGIAAEQPAMAAATAPAASREAEAARRESAAAAEAPAEPAAAGEAPASQPEQSPAAEEPAAAVQAAVAEDDIDDDDIDSWM